jgi:DtxR family Mn-dependent transcriptional regulator
MPSSTVEDYVKHIYMAAETAGSAEVSMGAIAEALGVVPGTATSMVKALQEAGLLKYIPRVGVALTPQGQALALHVLRRHRLLEQFLVEVLSFDWSEVHAEAERMEHVVSDRLLERIDQYLGRPTEDPHGDPIPNAAGIVGGDDLLSLLACPLQQTLQVIRIGDQNADFLKYIAQVGLGPGAHIFVQERNRSAQSIQIQLAADSRPITLGWGAAEKIWVRTQAVSAVPATVTAP